MSDPLSHTHYRELEFDRSAALVHPGQVAGLAALADQVSDLLVVSHGWNNDMQEARDLYRRMIESIEAQRAAGHEPRLAGRTIGYVGVLWPSKRFSDEELIPGGAANLGDLDPTLRADILARADAFSAEDSDQTLSEAASLVPRLGFSPAARSRYAELLRSLLDSTEADPEDASSAFFALDGEELFRRVDDPTLGDPGLFEPAAPPGLSGGALGIPPAGGSGGAAAGIFADLRSAGRQLLNFVTYYEMKNRAGSIGTALGPVLSEQLLGRTRVHLTGHSFGARLVTAAAVAASPGAGTVASMSLLQAAFSHYAFAHDWEPGKDGSFRSVLTRGGLTGPTIVTHTRHDRAVGIAYAVASRIAGQVASEIGDADSRFGGLGSNGAQRTPEAVAGSLLDTAADYPFTGPALHNLRADGFVSGHSDVTNRPVMHALLQAMAPAG